MFGTQIVRDKYGAFLGFRPITGLEPIAGPPDPCYGPLRRTVGNVEIARYPSSMWYVSNTDADYGDTGVELADELLDAVLAAITDLRREPFPLLGWRYPGGRFVTNHTPSCRMEEGAG